MLSRIHIKDLAIVTALEVEFHQGLTALTGETGAGKSILIDALGLVLGDRADNGMIRSDSLRAEITAVFRPEPRSPAHQWLEQHSLDSGEECILRRVLMRDGPSRAFINGSPVPVKSLLALGEHLVDIHGQHAHQSLLRRDQQRILLDEYGGNAEQCNRVTQLYRQWSEAAQRLTKLEAATQERAERLELLRYQIDELSRLELTPEELEELDRDQRRLGAAGRLQQQCAELLTALYEEEDSVTTRLTRASRELDEILTLEPRLSDCQALMEAADIQLREAISNLRQYAQEIELNPQRLEQIEQRLADIHDLARKYRCRPEELPQRLDSLSAECETLENADLQLDKLAQETKRLKQEYLKQAASLSQRRQQAAERMQQEVSEGIQALGMPHGEMQVQIEHLGMDRASATGLDRIEFLVSANPGMAPQPLAKVASGGELSRISLALQVATIRWAQVPTLIFDEVDVGIGGAVAEIVGRVLRQLGEQRQVLCVTHLAQVAAQGRHHLRIVKDAPGETVVTSVHQLDGETRVQEIARMLGGMDITSRTLAHAREMTRLSRS
jgi:DNA repair protein RecN (Recombination protein N)